MKNQLRTHSYSSNESDVLESSPVGENEVMKHDGRWSGSVFLLTHSLTDRKREQGSLYCARDAFTETPVISVTHCGSHAQPADAVTLQKQAPVERYGRRVRGKMNSDVAAFTAKSPVGGVNSCALSADVNCLDGCHKAKRAP